MAGEIQFAYGATGETVYAVLRNSVGELWNTAGAAFEVFNASNWSDYDIAVSEQGATGYYTGNFPSVSAGSYSLEVRKRAGGSPATTDSIVGAGSLLWDGAALTGFNDKAILVDTNELQTDWVNGGRLDLIVDAIKAKTDNLPASPAAVGSAMTLTSGERSAIAAAILAAGDIDGFTLEETLKLCLAALAGKLSGASGTTITIRSAADDANRIVATVDSYGNRSAVTLNAAG